MIATVPMAEPDIDLAGIDMPIELELPCRKGDPDLWFADSPTELIRAKTLCNACPLQVECLAGALARQEPWGVWGGEILERGVIIAYKRPRGRPRLTPMATIVDTPSTELRREIA